MPEQATAETDVTVQNAMGLHARPAALLVQCAGNFKSDITAECNGEIVNCSSILGLMVLSAARGSKLHLTAVGADCKAAVLALKKLFDDKFGEE